MKQLGYLPMRMRQLLHRGRGIAAAIQAQEGGLQLRQHVVVQDAARAPVEHLAFGQTLAL